MNGMAMTSRGRRIRRPVLPRAMLAGLGLTGLGYVMALMPEGTPGRGYWPWLMITGVGVLAAVVALWRHRRGGSAGLVTRWGGRGPARPGNCAAGSWTPPER